MNNIFVKNLPFEATKEDVKKLFAAFGTVTGVMLKEKKKGKHRGFGFLEMPNEDQKNKAIASLDGKDFMGRILTVSPAIPKAQSKFKFKKLKPGQKDWDEKHESRPFRKNSTQSKEWDPRRTASSTPSKPWGKSERTSKSPYKKTGAPTKNWGKTTGSSSKTSSTWASLTGKPRAKTWTKSSSPAKRPTTRKP